MELKQRLFCSVSPTTCSCRMWLGSGSLEPCRKGLQPLTWCSRLCRCCGSGGVVGKFVEFCGTGLSNLSLPDRATIANMAPEYGATVGFFSVDSETLAYLSGTGRDEEQVRLVEEYSKVQGLFRTDDSPETSFLRPTGAGPLSG